jgi:hemoglobin-like flavoprotein
VLQGLGLKHHGYSVVPAHYDLVGECVIETLADGLGAQFTDPVKNAWLKVYTIVKTTMCGACPYPENLEAGFKVNIQYPPVDVNAGLDERDIDLVQQSFAKAATLGADTVGKLIFTKIFTKAPEALQLFPSFKDDGLEFTHLFRADGKAIAHAVNVVSTVGTAVSLLRDLGSLVPVLQGLGLKHHGYSVVPAHYDLVGECVIETLSDGLGAQFTEPVKNAWLKVYGIVKKTMCDACPY